MTTTSTEVVSKSTETPPSTAALAPSATASPLPVISPEVEVYLEEAYTILYENSIRREVIDWDRFRERYDDRIAAVQPESLDDAHIVVQDAVHWLGDNHSVFLPPDEVTEWTNDHRISASRFEARLVDGKYGYINVPSFSSGSDESNNDFATQLQAVIAELEQDRPCGWIIDLRGNGGGNMWPMVTGVGPILGEGVFGANIRADGGTIEWRYADGQGWWGEELLAQTTNPPIELHEQQPPAAILLGRGTASAGEAVAIAFKGRPDTRFFGSNTSGFTTSPEPYYLSDGAIIFLSDSYMGDRNGTAYKFHVSPDEEVHLTDDFEAPTAWLAEQAQCQ